MKSEQQQAAIIAERFERGHRLLNTIAYRILGDEESAAIAIQNCWRTASRNPPRFESEGAFRSWLARVLIDESLDILRECQGTKRAHTIIVNPVSLSARQDPDLSKRERRLSMEAYIVEEPGGKFRKTYLARPTLRPNQVLVRIKASGVNPLDTKIRAGKASHAKQSLPAVLGVDMAGTVEEVVPGVTAFSRGDEVYGMVGGVGGLQGTLAEFIGVDTDLLAHKPKNLTMQQAAALPLVAITAWEALVDHAQVSAGQTVLIHAGAGGVGHVAVQLAHSYRAKVFATVSPNKKNIAESLGATPIDYRSSSVEEYVAKMTTGNGFDIVFDTVGGETLDSSFIAVKRYTGHVVSCLGWGTHSLAPLSMRGATYSGVFTLLPLIAGEGRAHHGKILARITALVEAGKLKPLLNDEVIPMVDIDTAHALVESGAVGKVVVELES